MEATSRTAPAGTRIDVVLARFVEAARDATRTA